MHGVVCGSGETCAAAAIPGGESVGMHRGQLETLPRPQRLQGAAELRRGAAGGNLAESAAKRTHAVQDMFQEKFGAMKWKQCVMVIAGAVALASCTGKNGKYLYVDGRYDVMHTRKTCSELKGFVVKGRHIPANVLYADLSYFYPAGNITYCKECFDDAQYEHAEAIFERNRPIYEKVKGLYEAMEEDGIVYEGFFDTYGYRFFLSGEEGYKIRKEVYGKLKAVDAISSPTYEEFLRRLGFPKSPAELAAEAKRKAEQEALRLEREAEKEALRLEQEAKKREEREELDKWLTEARKAREKMEKAERHGN